MSIKFTTERPEYEDVRVFGNAWAYSDIEFSSITVEQMGASITIDSNSVDEFIEALVLARNAAEAQLAKAKAELEAVAA